MTITKIQKNDIVALNKKDIKKKRRVAGYARVSTEKEEQQTSYNAQVSYFEDFIKKHEDWEYVGIYSDDGITGTCTRLRPGFAQMVKDALEGKIDLIITKSLSRFARNTVDSLITIRKLKEIGCECFFEKENIYTFDSKGELLITIMSSLAQEESRSISENVTWGMRKRIADGKYTINCKAFLGYTKDKVTGKYLVDEREALIVKQIYYMAFEGYTDYQIAEVLTNNNILTPTGKNRWYPSVVKSILHNEKYTGNALLQKSISIDYLTKKRKKNEGEIEQIYVSGGHPKIILESMFQRMQKQRKNENPPLYLKENISPLQLCYCGFCGARFTKNTFFKKGVKKEYYRCLTKAKGKKCTSPLLYEKEIKSFISLAIERIKEKKSFFLKLLGIVKLTDSQLDSFKSEFSILKMLDEQKRVNEIEEILKKDRVIREMYIKLKGNRGLDFKKDIISFDFTCLISNFVIKTKGEVEVSYLDGSKIFL